jgi:methyl halide transferase
MLSVIDTEKENAYWSGRYETQATGWDIGAPSPPLKAYIDQLQDKTIRILIPGAGNAYEAEYLYQLGFQHVYVMDISDAPLKNFQQRLPDFPEAQLLHVNFFEHEGKYDLILEQTFFCSFLPTKANRTQYAKTMAQLLNPGGKLVGLWFDLPLVLDTDKRPFGGTKEEYLSYFTPYFEPKSFETCTNSIPPRQGNELFGVFVKKDKATIL